MTQPCCPVCHLRFRRGWCTDDGSCPECGKALASRASCDLIGYSLWAPTAPPWAAANLDAVALAVSAVLPAPRDVP